MASESSPNLLIKASAGSGKTYELSKRYINLLLAGAKPDSILATTFTRKAAGEIQDRILKRLGEGALSEGNAKKLSKELTENETAYSEDDFRKLTIKVARSLDRLRVCTLDAFFMQLASGYAFELGLPPSWTIVEDVENDAILSAAIRQTFAQTDGKSAYELAKLLFKGETRKTIEKQVFDLTKDAFELVNESKADAWTALEKEIEPIDYDEDDCVAELENAELPRHKSVATARDELVGLLREKNWDKLVSRGLFRKVAKGDFNYYKPIEGEFKDALLRVKNLVANRLERALAEQLKNIWFVVASVARHFDEEKAKEGAYRFDDLANKRAKFVSSGAPPASALPDADRPGSTRSTEYRLDAKTRSLLLDEFQDASVKQWKIIRPFAELIVTPRNAGSAHENDPSSFFCVGDVKQAIYGWRGGVAEIFDAIKKEIPSVEEKSRSVNWRSCPTIIETVNKLFGKSGDQSALRANDVFAELKTDAADQTNSAIVKGVDQWSKGFEEHIVAEKNQKFDGCWTLEVAPSYDPISSNLSLAQLVEGDIVDATTGEPIREIDPVAQKELEGKLYALVGNRSDDDAENDAPTFGEDKRQRNVTLAYAARRVWELHRKYPNATIGVLLRSNDQLGEILRALKKLGVEASDEGGAPLVDAPSVGAILALLRLAAHPGDSVDAFCVANVKSLAERFKVKIDGVPTKLDPDRIDSETIRRVSAALRGAIETKGFGRFVAEARDLVKSVCDDKRQEERLDQLVEFAYGFQATSPSATLDAFVSAIENFKTQAPADVKVRVMTIHGSKGLQFDIVVLPELDGAKSLADISRETFVAGRKSPLAPAEKIVKYVGADERQLLPSDFQKIFQDASRQAIKEALCLLYVAVTRPKRALVAIVAPPKPSKTQSAPKTSFANILRCGLPCAEPNEDKKFNPQVLYTAGTYDWNADLKDDEASQNVEESKQEGEKPGRPTFQRDRRDSEHRQKRLLYQRKTPTGSPEDFAEDAATLARKGASPKNRVLFDWRSPKRYARGRCIHACYEQIEWLETSQATPDVNRLLPLAEFDREIVDAAIRDFNEELTSPFVAALLSRQTYESPDARDSEFFRDVPCAVADASRLAAPRFVVLRERPYQLVEGGVLWEGKIDRLVLLYDGTKLVGADVVDFKSDEKLVPERLDEYRLQLKRYGEAVERLYGLSSEKISLRIAFVTPRRLVDARTGTETVFDSPLLNAN